MQSTSIITEPTTIAEDDDCSASLPAQPASLNVDENFKSDRSRTATKNQQ